MGIRIETVLDQTKTFKLIIIKKIVQADQLGTRFYTHLEAWEYLGECRLIGPPPVYSRFSILREKLLSFFMRRK